jgi:hypothetical protein
MPWPMGVWMHRPWGLAGLRGRRLFDREERWRVHSVLRPYHEKGRRLRCGGDVDLALLLRQASLKSGLSLGFSQPLCFQCVCKQGLAFHPGQGLVLLRRRAWIADVHHMPLTANRFLIPDVAGRAAFVHRLGRGLAHGQEQTQTERQAQSRFFFWAKDWRTLTGAGQHGERCARRHGGVSLQVCGVSSWAGRGGLGRCGLTP